MNEILSLEEVAKKIESKFPQYKKRFFKIPNFVLRTVSFVISPFQPAFRSFINSFLGVKIRINSSKARKELGMTYLDIDQTLEDTVNDLVSKNLVKPL